MIDMYLSIYHILLCSLGVSGFPDGSDLRKRAQKSLADRAMSIAGISVLYQPFHLGRALRYPHIHGTPYVGALPARFMLHFYWLRSLMRRGAVPCRRAFPLGFSLDAQTPYAVPTYDFLMEWHH